MSISKMKIKAKNVLSYSYWLSFGATLIFMLLYTGISSFSMIPMYSSELISSVQNDISLSPQIIMGMLAAMGIFLIIGMVIVLFVGVPIWVGHNSFYIKAANRDLNLAYIFDGFKHSYLNTVKIMFLYSFYIMMWFLLLTIPIIVLKVCFSDINEYVISILALLPSIASTVKKCQYFMIEYIIADNPEISARRAFEISKAATKGNKFKIFLLELSFIGWFLLGTLLCGFGIFFVMPYFYAARTQCYLYLKENAIKYGYASHADFNTDTLKGYVL